MDRDYRNKLLKEAAEDPVRLLERKKFWRLELWPHYLRRCDDIVYGDPFAGLAFSEPAPRLAAKIAKFNPGTNGADFMLLGHSYLASAFRRTDDYASAAAAFREARQYKDMASPKALAEHLRRAAYFLLYQQDPDCFPVIGEALSIHKRGNLVHRHAFGECLICRGRAYVMFNQHGKSFDDYTAALNHVSIKIDPKPYYCALHCLANLAVIYGTDEELQVAYDNLKEALLLLNTIWGRPYPKLKLRWLIAVIHARLGALGRAEEIFLEIRTGLVKLKLGYELGMLSIDLALLYLAQSRYEELEALVPKTAALFGRIGVERRAEEALDVWRQANKVDEDLLKNVRDIFFRHAAPMPAIAA